MANLDELRKAEFGLSVEKRLDKCFQLIGSLSQLVDETTWALALNTTYGYIREVDETRIRRLIDEAERLDSDLIP